MEIILLCRKETEVNARTLQERLPNTKSNLVFPLEPPRRVDCAIHIEQISYVWAPWARVNILLLSSDEYDSDFIERRFDRVLFLEKNTMEAFQTLHPSIQTSLAGKENEGIKELQLSIQKTIVEKPKQCELPPLLSSDEYPQISVVTLLYNRRKFFDLACHNIMLSDYPKNKIEWIVIEDSDDPNEDASDRVVQVAMKATPINVVYIPLDKKTAIGKKRNMAIEKATSDIILMMDDDDHYPQTSFRRRVSWLLKHPWQAPVVACTTIACYDLLKGISFVNTPPHTLLQSKRISEATLTFKKDWWEKQMFSETNLSEGEGILKGREQDLLEIPPQQILVAFTHRKNASGRGVPAGQQKAGCFWGFPKEFLVFIHNLAGISIEAEAEEETNITS